MIQNVEKPSKVALCRVCHGTGRIKTGNYSTIPTYGVCPQCEGSGRVTVSAKMTLDIRPYKPKVKPSMND